MKFIARTGKAKPESSLYIIVHIYTWPGIKSLPCALYTSAHYNWDIMLLSLYHARHLL